MAERHYRAFISYSHRDESWAKWLHGSLESYRIPRKLRERDDATKKFPNRISPVFRDRDELSTASELGDKIKQALAESDNLIVVCSPDSAASHWVNEEIRYFAGLGKGERIFCIIVNGETADDGSVAALFPTALSEIGFQEPLAADARKWADGKNNAKLKVIAGLLGIRLDELCQRDIQRHRVRQVLVGIGITGAISLAAITIVSQISERNERDKAEQLATFVVDLGERLKSDVDLETQALIGAEALKHLEQLDPQKLKLETGKRVALALRQMGRVSQSQGKPKQALDVLQRSRELLANLHFKYPESIDVLFELGNAEYYIGNLHNRQGRYDAAVDSMQKYFQLTSKLVEADPGNPDWVMELAYSHNNLAALELNHNNQISQDTLTHVDMAVSLMSEVAEMKPKDSAVADGYATILAWAADAQLEVCNLTKANSLRIKVRDLAEFASRSDPSNNDLKRRFAFSVSGVAAVQYITSQTQLAEQNLRQAVSVLQQLYAADPSNKALQEETLYRRFMLAKLLSETGQNESATQMMAQLDSEYLLATEAASDAAVLRKDYADLLLSYAELQTESNDRPSAIEQLKKVQKLIAAKPDRLDNDYSDAKQRTKAQYQWWLLTGQNNFDAQPNDDVTLPNNEFKSCDAAETAAFRYVMDANYEGAAREVAYLIDKEYLSPGFIRFCKRNNLCP